MRSPRRFIPRLAHSAAGIVGLAILALVLAVAFLGPLIAPHSITATVGPPGQDPAAACPSEPTNSAETCYPAS